MRPLERLRERVGERQRLEGEAVVGGEELREVHADADRDGGREVTDGGADALGAVGRLLEVGDFGGKPASLRDRPLITFRSGSVNSSNGPCNLENIIKQEFEINTKFVDVKNMCTMYLPGAVVTRTNSRRRCCTRPTFSWTRQITSIVLLKRLHLV